MPPAPPPRPPPSPFSTRYHRRSLVHSVECPTKKFATSWDIQSCDVLFHAPRGGRAARYRENRAVQLSHTPDKKHANGAVCRTLPKKKQGQQEEATPLCPSANSSTPHAQQVPKPVVSVLRCRIKMVMIVEVKTWPRRPVLRTGAAGAPTRKETAGPHSACVVRSRRRHVHLQRRRAGDRPAMPRRVEAHPPPCLCLRQRSHPAPWGGHTRQILEDKEEFQVT